MRWEKNSDKKKYSFRNFERAEVSFYYRVYGKHKRMSNGIIMLDISFQNKFVITLGLLERVFIGPGASHES